MEESVTSSIIIPENLGTDPVGRGAGWRKTNNANAVAMGLHDIRQVTGMSGGELFGALVENVIAAIQGGTAPHAWAEAADGVCDQIKRRCRRT